MLSIINTFWSTKIENRIWNFITSFDSKSLYFLLESKFKNSKSPTNSSSVAFILNRDNAFFKFFNNDKSL